MVGLVMQRAMVLCLFISLPIMVVWQHMIPLLDLMGIPPEVAVGTARYLYIFSPALIFGVVSCVLEQYLMSQVS